MTSEEFIHMAKGLIALETYPGNVDNIKLVWFSKILENYKCILVDLRIMGFVPKIHNINEFVEPEFKPSGKIYECTFNGNKNEIYLDIYNKEKNRVYSGYNYKEEDGNEKN